MASPDPKLEIPITVFKIGGSLLGLPGLGDLVRQILGERKPQAALLVAGGGVAADAVRGWDRVHRLGDQAAHTLALEAMNLTGALLDRLLPGTRPVRSPQQARVAAADGVVGLLCADCFVKSATAAGEPELECSWRVTSDSIAAWTARALRSPELVLVKSVAVPQGVSLAEAADSGLVDEAFPAIAAALPQISWVNARAQRPAIESWTKRKVTR